MSNNSKKKESEYAQTNRSITIKEGNFLRLGWMGNRLALTQDETIEFLLNFYVHSCGIIYGLKKGAKVVDLGWKQ